jgi:leader peptidase (prepilin peptidase)/N-methyltransferase
VIESAAPLDLARHGLLLAVALAVIALQPPYPFLVVRAIRRSPKGPRAIRRVGVWAAGLAGLFGLAALLLQPVGLVPVLLALALLLWLLALLDVRYFWLPDRMTWPLLIAGLAAAWPDQENLMVAAVGAAVGGAAFYAVHFGFRAIRGYDGLGLGDVKLLAAFGAWVGGPALPWLVLLASLSALAMATPGLIGAKSTTRRIPFGAHLALAGFVLVCLRQSPYSAV